MKTKQILLIAVAAVILLASYKIGFAEAEKQIAPAKIGVVKISEVFQNCKQNQQYKQQFEADQQKAIAELDKLSTEVSAIQADLKTRKVGSGDYLELTKKLYDKKAAFQSAQDYFQKELSIKEQSWTEKLYQQILDAVKKVAQQKGLDIVLESTQPELPAASSTELMVSIRTNKVLYSAANFDITKEVLAAVDE